MTLGKLLAFVFFPIILIAGALFGLLYWKRSKTSPANVAANNVQQQIAQPPPPPAAAPPQTQAQQGITTATSIIAMLGQATQVAAQLKSAWG